MTWHKVRINKIDSKRESALRITANDVKPSECGKLASRMHLITMRNRKNAVGFAANQLSSLHHGYQKANAFLALIDNKWRFFANAKENDAVLSPKETKNTKKGVEGCLSIPGRLFLVKRTEWIHITWTDEYGHECRGSFSGFSARIIQHEMDHLKGLLICDENIGSELIDQTITKEQLEE